MTISLEYTVGSMGCANDGMACGLLHRFYRRNTQQGISASRAEEA